MTAIGSRPVDHLPAGILPGGRFAQWVAGPVRYVVCDVDGTLVGPAATASSEVVEAIARAQGRGLRVGFATGRMRDGIADLREQVGAVGPHVLHNGAEVRADGATIASWTLSSEQVDALLELNDERDDCYLEVYTSTGFLVSAADERARPHWQILGTEPRGILTAAAQVAGLEVLKGTFVTFSDDASDWLLARLRTMDVESARAESPLTPGLAFINATSIGADKGAALRHAAAHLGLAMADVAAIGDSANDLSMLQVAGTAIAMGQAADDIHQAAHLVVPEVDAHGVAIALDALVAGVGRG